MGRPVLTDAQVESFRERVTEVATDLFAEQGFTGFSMRALAQALGCSHATPYRYFASKDELFATVRAGGFQRFGDFLRARLTTITEPEARVRELASAYFDFAQNESTTFAVIFEMGQSSDEFPFVDEAGTNAWGVLYATIADAIEHGVLRGEPNVLAHTMWAGVHGVATLQVAGKLRMGRTGTDIVADLVDSLIRAHRPSDVGGDLRDPAGRPCEAPSAQNEQEKETP